MTSSDSGYRIGFRELYELVMQVSAKLDSVTSVQAQQIQANTSRIEGMSIGMTKMWEQWGKDKEEIKEQLNAKASNAWQINLAIGTGVASFLTALATIIIK